jgi:hypothetical protein
MIWVWPSGDFLTTETQRAQSRGRPLTADNRPSTAKYAKPPSAARSTSLRASSASLREIQFFSRQGLAFLSIRNLRTKKTSCHRGHRGNRPGRTAAHHFSPITLVFFHFLLACSARIRHNTSQIDTLDEAATNELVSHAGRTDVVRPKRVGWPLKAQGREKNRIGRRRRLVTIPGFPSHTMILGVTKGESNVGSAQGK